ncbi:hypothetical protein ACJMK2_017680 [Sinanodonta woodiana]|uniref:C-type lectin domain-containing protein n=1 Tax=Sinanodonta woodiana TaxID=1069815 RepID=A0ABD3UB24_SINWO
MKFQIFLVALGLLSDCRITSFTRGVSIFPAPPVPVPVRIAPLVSQWQSARYPGYGSAFLIFALATLVVILPILHRPTSAPGCPSTYYLYSTTCGRFCYRYESSECKSWTSARTTCRAEGGDLLVPSECFYQFFKDHARQNEGSCSNFWIGGSTTTPGSNYTSVRGDLISNSVPLWASGQPDAFGGTESCIEMFSSFNYLMNDAECSNSKGFICQLFV